MIANALIGIGMLSVALGAWMNWHPAFGPLKPGTRYSDETWSISNFVPGVRLRYEHLPDPDEHSSWATDDERGLELRLRPYYAKNMLPRTWMRLGLTVPVPSYHRKWVKTEDGEYLTAGWDQYVRASATLIAGDRTVGPFAVEHWFYNTFKTYDKNVIFQVISMLEEYEGALEVRMEYTGGYSGKDPLVKIATIPNTNYVELFKHMPETKGLLSDHIEATIRPRLTKHSNNIDQWRERRQLERRRKRWRSVSVKRVE